MELLNVKPSLTLMIRGQVLQNLVRISQLLVSLSARVYLLGLLVKWLGTGSLLHRCRGLQLFIYFDCRYLVIIW